jgi:hypothetical protein
MIMWHRPLTRQPLPYSLLAVSLEPLGEVVDGKPKAEPVELMATPAEG